MIILSKIEIFLDKIYSNGNSLYFYYILGGLALILILFFILGNIKPKNNKNVEEIKNENIDPNNNLQEKTVNEVESPNNIENTLIMEPITNELINNPPIIDNPPIINEAPINNDVINKSFSPVYLDIKPKEEPISKPEINLETNTKLEPEIKLEPNLKLEPVVNKEEVNVIDNQNLSINPEIFAKEDNNKEESNHPLMDNENINASPLKLNPIAESKILDNEVNLVEEENSYDNSNLITEFPKMKPEFIEEEKIDPEPDQKTILEDIKPILIDEEKIITEDNIQNHQETTSDENNIKKSETIVFDADEIQSKLNELSNLNQDNDNSKDTLNELLKQIGMEDNDKISSLNDEEAILLGK